MQRHGPGRANILMSQLFVGTSGWAYPTWKPDFYPAKLAQKKFLNHYATRLNTVEVNFTFRQLLKEKRRFKTGCRIRPPTFVSGIKELASGHHPHQAAQGDGRLSLPRFLATPLSRWHRPAN